MQSTERGSGGAMAAFGSVSLTSWSAESDRARAHGRAGSADVHLHLVLSGAIAMEGPGRTAPVAEATSVLLIPAGHHRTVILRDAECVTVRVPQEVVGGSGIDLPDPTVLDPESALFAPFAAFVTRAVEVAVDDASTFSAYYFERLLQEMTIGLVIDSLRARVAPRAPEQFTVALALLTAQLSDPDLTPAAIARELNTSLRQLQRQFRRHATTVEQEIRRARVDHAARLLRDRGYDALSVDQVARYSGFAGGSSLARAMAAENLPSPARLRRESRVAVE